VPSWGSRVLITAIDVTLQGALAPGISTTVSSPSLMNMMWLSPAAWTLVRTSIGRLYYLQLGRHGHRGQVDRLDDCIGEGFAERWEEVIYARVLACI
jgi:hypothetical protein